MAGDAIRWRGWGRWLAFVLGTLLLIYGIPLLLDDETLWLAVWNIFLGLLIAGVVGLNYRHAPGIAIGLAVLLAIRLAIALVFLSWTVATLSDVLLFALGAAVATDLRRQRTASRS